ncbi:hypothetical protein BG015_008959 [Linnemannia schmuckeri]|uniref:Uncharacterized protein n=1 Tax=Linnemannia schmuckeri TaxID=64567 RepID=A0A9P5RW70_9FUNG|nr:hypothetical protein BG015_008959 [Linnemannia schmuckeri]
MTDNDKSEVTQCQHCEVQFPAHGIERLLPVFFEQSDRLCEVLLCLKCRRKELEINKEPYLRAVEVYKYPGFGVSILPWITESEAKVQYCLEDSHLGPLPHVVVNSVQAAGKAQKIKMYYEKLLLDKARWVFGGEVGISNVRIDLAIQQGLFEQPPAGDVRERRSLIRHVFLEKGFFADPKLVFVKEFVEENHGELDKIVPLYAV